MIALAGNPNVGKSVVFNSLTGLSQRVGNWPGKTVERAEGELLFDGRVIKVIDLPGTYSLTGYSEEEEIARDFIVHGKPDVIVNVVDASALERNLYLTLQLLELGRPVVVALNMVDFAAKKGLKVNHEELSRKLGVPVVPTVAVRGMGLREVVEEAVKAAEKEHTPKPLEYGKEVEMLIKKLEQALAKEAGALAKMYPLRWIAIRLLEGDPSVEAEVLAKGGSKAIELAKTLRAELEKIHGHPASVVIAHERYSLASRIATEAIKVVAPPKLEREEWLDRVTTHPAYGYIILAGIMAGVLTFTFVVGDFLSGLIEDALLAPFAQLMALVKEAGELAAVIATGALDGLVAGVAIVLPYIVPLYFMLTLLEDSGYLPRAALLMDPVLRKMGLHGKAFFPVVLGYGCDVPACLSCRILPTDREKWLATLAVVLVPCVARSVVILGLVAEYVGLTAALGIYAFDFALIVAIGALLHRTRGGEVWGLLMEVPPYRLPNLRTIIRRTWALTVAFVRVAFPLIIAGSVVLSVLEAVGAFEAASHALSWFTVGILGLPDYAIIPLFLGFLRKELALLLLEEAAGVADLSLALTDAQMVTFALVTTVYIPCLATVGALVKERGWKAALSISALTLALGTIVGAVAARVVPLIM